MLLFNVNMKLQVEDLKIMRLGTIAKQMTPSSASYFDLVTGRLKMGWVKVNKLKQCSYLKKEKRGGMSKQIGFQDMACQLF